MQPIIGENHGARGADAGKTPEPTILVVPGTGTVARLVVGELSRAGHPVRALVPGEWKPGWKLDGERAPVYGVEVRGGFDYRHVDSLGTGLEGIRTLYLESSVHPDWVAETRAVIERALAAGVRRIVRLSLAGCGTTDRGFGATRLGQGHREIERVIEDRGVAFTFLRPTWYMSNFRWHGTEMRARGTFTHPFGRAALSLVAPEDVAAVAARVLAGPDAGSGVLELTGPARLTIPEALGILATSTGLVVRGVELDLERFGRWMEDAWGMSDLDVAMVLDMYREGHDGNTADLAPDLAAVLHRTGMDLGAWMERHRVELVGPAAPHVPSFPPLAAKARERHA